MDYRMLPKVDTVAAQAADMLPGGGAECARPVLVDAARQAIAALRAPGGAAENATRAQLLARAVEDTLARYHSALSPSLRPVINATGVVLHTGLGRAPLAQQAVRAAVAAAGYCNLELDLDSGSRGSRHDHVSALLRALTGAEDALVVNNNAAALLLTLDTLAQGGETVVSRGQLVEIGGGFRIPEVIAHSRAILREVGSTNKTRLDDYADAIGAQTACLLQVHPSNFVMEGFVETVATPDLAALAHAHGLPLVYDLGSGCLHPFAADGIGREPLPAQVVAEGADILTFSGDKLLGGPQAGIIVGKSVYLAQLKKNPLLRALRVDKLTLAALEATLALYRAGRGREIPTVSMLCAHPAALREKALALRTALEGVPAALTVAETTCPTGGGALPGVRLATWVVEVAPTCCSAGQLLRRLRTGTPPVLAYIHENKVRLDLRTVEDGALDTLTLRLREALG